MNTGDNNVLGRLIISLHGSGIDLRDQMYSVVSDHNPQLAVSIVNQWFLEFMRQIFDNMDVNYGFGQKVLAAGISSVQFENKYILDQNPDLMVTINQYALQMHAMIWNELRELGVWNDSRYKEIMLEGLREDIVMIAVLMPRNTPFG